MLKHLGHTSRLTYETPSHYLFCCVCSIILYTFSLPILKLSANLPIKIGYEPIWRGSSETNVNCPRSTFNLGVSRWHYVRLVWKISSSKSEGTLYLSFVFNQASQDFPLSKYICDLSETRSCLKYAYFCSVVYSEVFLK